MQEKDEQTESITISGCPRSVRYQLKLICVQDNKSMKSLITEILKKYIHEYKQKKLTEQNPDKDL